MSFVKGCRSTRSLRLWSVLLLWNACSKSTFHTATAAPLEDLVLSLPEYGRPPTPHFSGYLNATAGCDTSVNGPYCGLHYWLALHDPSTGTSHSEQQQQQQQQQSWNAQDVPLIIWMNGGPGSSSLFGFLLELGPLLLNRTGTGLMENPWAWNKVGHLLALEAPVGVGFSYCANMTHPEGGQCDNNDDLTASANRAALQDFFQRFPELRHNPVYITGESYAGVYVPTLVREILQHAPDINLQGMAVGDPCTDNDAQHEIMDSLVYGHKNGLVDDKLFHFLWDHCQVRQPNDMMNDVHDQDSGQLYDGMHPKHFMPNFRDTDECNAAYYKYVLSTSQGFNTKWDHAFLDRFNLYGAVSKEPEVALEQYLSRQDVRVALHVEKAPVESFHRKNPHFEYTKQYNACNPRASEDAPSMIDVYRTIVPQLTATWVYNGDADPAVPYEGTRQAVDRIGLQEVDGGGYRPWFYNQSAAPMHVWQEKNDFFGPNLPMTSLGAQLGGYVVNYESGLTFLTIHGSGHLAPQVRPQAALHMIEKLVQAGCLMSPLMPTNATLEDLDWHEFLGIQDEWTGAAMKAPFVTSQSNQACVRLGSEQYSETA